MKYIFILIGLTILPFPLHSQEIPGRTKKIEAPQSAEFLLQHAKRLYNDSNYENAITDLKGVIALDPLNYEAWHYLGGSYHHLHNYPEAITAYTKALEINPTSEYTFHNRGLSKHYQGNQTAAIEDYTRSLGIKRDFFKSLYFRGLANLEIGNYDLAINDLTYALTLNPGHYASWYLKGLSRYKKGDISGAKSDYAQAVQINHDRKLPGYEADQNPFGIKKIEKNEQTYPEKQKRGQTGTLNKGF